jgi:hypothetical protein
MLSCSDTPSNADARAVFEKQWQKEIDNGVVKVTKFEKLDGVAGELMGVKLYTMKYEAEITWPKGNDIGCGQGPNSNPYYPCKVRDVGQKEKFNGRIEFQKTERGWQGEARPF